RKLPTPIFLGIDRKRQSDYPYVAHRAYDSWRGGRVSFSNKSSNLNDALEETQMMTLESYKGIKNLESKQNIALRGIILKSSFKFVEPKQVEDLFDARSINKKTTTLLEKKKNILSALRKISDIDSSITEEVNVFFSGLSSLISDLEDVGYDNPTLNLNWLVNHALIDRIIDLVDVIEDYENKIQKIYEPLDTFINTMNLFFKDSDKTLEVDSIGRMHIKVKNSSRPLDLGCLSSGEKQILIIVANVFFNKYGPALARKRTLIIIDEPELSLHMRWQEMFSDIVLSTSPDTQFILATHSPDIVGDLHNKTKIIRTGK
ncbi:TPA: AAA family ATPase, partial [Vibrio parahaemolyticus]|nr:AAA family ATPase [Vibrio parahaemolyticus]